LAIFQGPHTYISPSWYEVHPSVPTWDYAVVHAYGKPRLLDDDALHALLRDSVTLYESPSAQPWRFDSLTDDYVRKMMRAIVGLEIEITRLEGKLKLSQNRSEADRAAVITALEQTADPMNAEVAEWMQRHAPE